MNTTDSTFQYFSGTGADFVAFGGPNLPKRKVNRLLLTTSGSATISFDGTNFMPITNGTYQFEVPLGTLWFGAGTWSGYGVSL